MPLIPKAALVALMLAPAGVQGQSMPVVDPDSLLSMKVPQGWVDMDLGVPDATIQMASADQDAFFLVITEAKEDLVGWNLTRYSYIILGQSMVGIDFPTVDEEVDIEVDGSPARRHVITGVTQGARVTFLRVTIEAPTAFIQLMGWSSRSAWEREKPILEGIMSSVDLLD